MQHPRVSVACMICFLALVPQTLTSPDQLLHIFISVVETVSGRPRSNGTGCNPPHNESDDALMEEFLELVRNVSEVAVVLDDKGRRPRQEPPNAADAGNETESGLLDRSLVNATPTLKTCPPGQQRDRLGKCRTAIPSAKVWAT
ncbi:uncharacterized protein LOC126355083 isoform X2 [Schistocerca gregaria]|uniref:uncharacterized protein LOC126355083 isoform X2 n=1 Tax=Schistocerca gregaria TaxID=7010 RepID=UPI00211F3EFF|nr:uncharacterized protein LOC126355083 isoform X2 [Schistocerca gregaria]